MHRRIDSRRDFFKLMGLGGLFFTARGAFAEELTLTPSQTIGPYYPNVLPLDRDNDLLVIGDAITPAVGDIAWVGGRVLDRRGDPIRGALVEIWQADSNGAYIHTASAIRNRDAGFQGYGKFVTGSTGEYVFRTIKPGIYPGRTRHIHYAVTIPGQQIFATQLYEAGLALNNNDGVLNGIRDAAQRASVIVPWTGITGSRIGEVAAKFDIVMGYTAPDKIVSETPRIFSLAGISNAASFIPATAASSRLRILGYGFATADAREIQPEDVVDGRLPESLNGVSVQIDGQAAAVLSVSPEEVQVLTPNEVNVTTVQVVVSNPNGVSDAASVEVRTRMPALFLESQGYVTASREDGVRVGPEGIISETETQPARPGDLISLYATGLGRTDPEVPSMSAVSDPAPNVAEVVTVRLHTQAISPQAARLVKPGYYEIQFVVPQLDNGDYGLALEVGGVRTEKSGRLHLRNPE